MTTMNRLTEANAPLFVNYSRWKTWAGFCARSGIEGESEPGSPALFGQHVHAAAAELERRKVAHGTADEVEMAYEFNAIRRRWWSEWETISVEADNLSPRYAYKKVYRPGEPERDNFRVLVTRNIGIEGAWDLLLRHRDGRLVMPDAKTGWDANEQQHEWQAKFYCFAALTIYDYAPSVTFVPVYLRFPSQNFAITWTREQMPDLEAWLIDNLSSFLEDCEPAEEFNRYCGSCSLRSDCATYQRETLPIPARDAFTSPAEAWSWRERAKAAKKVGEAVYDAATAYLRDRLEIAPIQAGGVTLVGSQSPHRHSYDRNLTIDALVSAGVDPVNYMKLDTEALSGLASTHPQLWNAIRASREVSSWRYNITAKPAALPDVSEAAPSLAETAVESAAPSLPPAADAPLPVEDIAGTSTASADATAVTDSLPVESAGATSTTTANWSHCPSGSAATGAEAAGSSSDSDEPRSGSPGVLEQSDAAPETGASSSQSDCASSDLPLFSEHEPWKCPACGSRLTAVEAIFPLAGHWGLSCPSHAVVGWTPKACIEVGIPIPIQPPPGEIPFTHPLEGEPAPAAIGADLDWPAAKEPEAPQPAKKTRNRRPTPTHSCGRKCRWESAGSKTAWCPNCSEVFTPVYREENVK